MTSATSSDRLRIVHALAPGAVGGLESVVRTLCAAQRDRGHDVQVYAVVDRADEDTPFLAGLRNEAIPHQILEAPGRRYWRERRAFRDFCEAARPDVVHCHGYRADLMLAPAARQQGICSITTVHGFCGGSLRNRVYEWLDRRSMRHLDAVVAVSEAQRPILLDAGVEPSKLQVLPNAWQPAGEFAEPAEARSRLGLVAAGPPVIGFVGRLSFEKGADVLLAALERIREIPWQMSFVGDGEERAALEERARGLELHDRMTWHGNVPDAWHCFRGFDVLVLPSRTEGTPITLFEAMAAGVPVVATAVGGVPDVIAPHDAGDPVALLVEPEDPKALADAIRETLEDREATHTRIQGARRALSERYATEPWESAYARIYSAAMRESGN